MEMTLYKCPLCGFAYQVPAYWGDFAPEEELEMEHFDLEAGEMCSERIMQLVKE